MLLLAQPASPGWGGEGFLNRNARVNEAVPYGREAVTDAAPSPQTPIVPQPAAGSTPAAGGAGERTPGAGTAPR